MPRKLLVSAAICGGLLVFGYPLLIVDAIIHGPYCSWYNGRCQSIADRNHLVGRPDRDVSAILGTPSSVWNYGEANGKRLTYNYDPSGIETGMFQVHCKNGVVVGTEQFDD